MIPTTANVEKTLDRSKALLAIIMREVYLIEHDNSFRSAITKCLSGISFEHSNSLMILMAASNYTTAVSFFQGND